MYPRLGLLKGMVKCLLITGLAGPVGLPAIHTAAQPAGSVVAWGWVDGPVSGTVVPAPAAPEAAASGVVAIAAGYAHALALKQDGTVVAWGSNLNGWGGGSGQATVPQGLNNVVAIAAGGYQSMALKRDGAVVAWGSVMDDLHATIGGAAVPAGLSNVVAIAASARHSLALKTDGTVVAWCCDHSMPVPSDLKRVVAIAAGEFYSVALLEDGTTTAWELEYGGPIWFGDEGDAVALAADVGQFVTLRPDGTVATWGWRPAGCPPASGPPGSNFVGVATGYAHSLALRQDGTVAVWGSCYYQGTWWSYPSRAGLTNVIALAASDQQSLALVHPGTLPPRLVGSPRSQTVEAGSTVSLSVVAAGTVPLACQWFFNGANRLPGATNSMLLFPAIQPAQAGAYTVTVTNLYGSLTTSATITVLEDPPRIIQGPQTQTVDAGETAWINVVAEGSLPLSYQWFFNGTNVLAGATDAAFALRDIQPRQAGAYAVVITNVYGSITSSTARVTVNPAAPYILVTPRTQTAEAGTAVQFQVRAVGRGVLSYRWLFNGSDAPGAANHPSLLLPAVQPWQAGGYTVVITNLYGAATTDIAGLSIIAPVPRRTIPALRVTGDLGVVVHLSYADTAAGLTSGQALDTFTLTNSPQLYLDRSVPDPLPPQRFYGVWQTNPPSPPPALDIGMATEITLTGAIGSNVRIDYINQLGPTNAWIMLDTAKLTNTVQPYFDLDMWRQPTRLYRLVPAP